MVLSYRNGYFTTLVHSSRIIEEKLVVLFPDISLLTQSVNIIFPYSEYIPRKTRLFIDYLKENIQL